MSWVLVYITISGGVAHAETVDYYDDMFSCFRARGALSEDVGRGNGHFNPGSQAICIMEEGTGT